MKTSPFTSRVIFFHGYAQSASVFYAKTSALRKRLMKLGHKCVYLNAPDRLTPAEFPSNDALSKFGAVDAADDEETNLRTWWVKPQMSNNNIGLGDAVKTLRDYIEENKVEEEEDFVQDVGPDDSKLPIVGLVGFSQGAALVGVMLGKLESLFGLNTVQFALIYCGFRLDTANGSGNERYDSYYVKELPATLRVLHVIGELDSLISEERSMVLYHHYEKNSDILKHPGGHFVPNSKMYVEQVASWIATPREEPKKKDDDLDDLLDMMDSIGKV